MPTFQKQKVLGFLIFTTALVALLALGLASIEMQPGEIVTLQISEQSQLSDSQPPMDVDWFFVFLQGFLVVLIILTIVHIFISLFDRDARRKLFANLLRFGLLFLLISLFLNQKLPDTPQVSTTLEPQPEFPEPPEFTGEVITPPDFEASAQLWMLIVIIIGMAVLIAAITFFGLRALSKRAPVDDGQFLDLANTAQAALNDIEEAEIEFDDVIIRCYAEMSQALQSEKGIKRKEAVTPHEFENELLAEGFPAHPVQQLTQLFEQVRYGRQQHGEDAKERAKESLGEIIAFCRGPV